MSAAFLSGMGVSAIEQYAYTREIDFGTMIKAGVYSAISAGIMHGVQKAIDELGICFVVGTPVRECRALRVNV